MSIVLSFIDHTNQNIFLTGKAGTGKTTLLKQIKAQSSKKMVIIAPTGVAAMNAKGTTINSFFQLPPGSFFPGEISFENLQSGILSIASVVSNMSYSKDKIKLFNELELLVIDEISMVRCDLMDVIDAILRAVRNNNMPFGGVQLLLIGDLYQLPPVTKREEWTFLSRAYASPYFFEAFVIKRNPLLQIELTKVYRQTEPEFIGILNDIRNNQISEQGLALLNQRYQPSYKFSDEVSPIIITSHNAEANNINKEKLDELDGEEFTFDAEISGEFKDLSLQAEQCLKLKAHSQVMFIKNDTGDARRYYNGKIGKVKSISSDHITIYFPDEEEDLLLEKTTWQAFEYRTDADQAIMQQQIGEFSQYPIKLAWAVTIHKSQGLTFDKAIIDAGQSFVSGQVYVALSRVRTLNGLILKSKIRKESLRSNHDVIKYMKPATETELQQLLIVAQEKFILQLILNHFSLSALESELEVLVATPELVKANLPEFRAFQIQVDTALKELMNVCERFQSQVRQVYEQTGFTQQEKLQERIVAASVYFRKEINNQILSQVNKNIRIKAKNKAQQQVQHLLQKYRTSVDMYLHRLQLAADLLKEPIKVVAYESWIDKHKVQTRDKPDLASAHQQSISLQLF